MRAFILQARVCAHTHSPLFGSQHLVRCNVILTIGDLVREGYEIRFVLFFFFWMSDILE